MNAPTVCTIFDMIEWSEKTKGCTGTLSARITANAIPTSIICTGIPRCVVVWITYVSSRVTVVITPTPFPSNHVACVLHTKNI